MDVYNAARTHNSIGTLLGRNFYCMLVVVVYIRQVDTIEAHHAGEAEEIMMELCWAFLLAP